MGRGSFHTDKRMDDDQPGKVIEGSVLAEPLGATLLHWRLVGSRLPPRLPRQTKPSIVGVVVEKVRNLSGAEGLNAATGVYEDLVKIGVIDAAKVTRSALQNAASIAALFLTTEAVVADKPEKDNGGGMGGGGMEDF